MTTRGQTKAGTASRWPWQNSLPYRMLFACGAVFMAAVAVLAFWIGSAVYQSDLDAGKHELEVFAFLAANALEDPLSGFAGEFEKYGDQASDSEDGGGGDDSNEDSVAAASPQQSETVLEPRLRQVASRYAADTNAIVTIYNLHGDAIADSHLSEQLPKGQLVGAQDLAAALKNGADVSLHPSTGEPSEMVIVATAPIQQSDELLGFVQISKPVAAVTADARAMLLNSGLVALATLTLAALAIIWIGRRLVQPLRRLEEAAFAVAEGDLSQAVTVQSNDEVGALARAFNYMVGEVRSTLEKQQAFVANASHELRTPLTNIKLRSEILRSLHIEDPELEDRYLVEIEAEAERLTRLANDLLDLARLETSGPRLAVEPTDIALALHKVADIMQLRAQQAGLSLQTAIPGALPHLRVRADDLEVIAINLLDNAIKYTPRGGQIQLQAAPTAAGVEIRVEDNGPGIPEADRAHIFERFYRVDKARSRRAGSGGSGGGSGAGLGLTIVRDLVHQNGGQIQVTPAPGGGTIFLVAFPASA